MKLLRSVLIQVIAVSLIFYSSPSWAQNNDWRLRQLEQQRLDNQRRQQQEINRQAREDRERQIEQARRDREARERERRAAQTRNQQTPQARQEGGQTQGQTLNTNQGGGNSSSQRSSAVRNGEKTVYSNGISKKPLTATEIKRGFTGKFTSDGRALVKFQGRVLAVPAARVGIAPRPTATSQAALQTRWNENQKNTFKADVQKILTLPASNKSGDFTNITAEIKNRIDAAKLKDKVIITSQGEAFQSSHSDAILARKKVDSGAILYKIGKTEISTTAGTAEFWALEHPSTPGYAKRHGIPSNNVDNPNFIQRATLKPGSDYITRVVPPAKGEPEGGGAIEVVVNEDSVIMQSFSHSGGK